MYGPTASGQNLRDVLASIEVGSVTSPYGQERLGHYVRSDLIFELDGSGAPGPKKYRLNLNVGEFIATPIVNTATGRAITATLTGTATFTVLKPDGQPLFPPETAIAHANYDRNVQRFTTIRAARDADIRVAKLLAEQIRTRLAIKLAGVV